MKIYSADLIIKKYIEYAEIEGQTKLDGNYRLGNKMSKKIIKLFLMFKDDCETAKYIIQNILISDCRRARILIAVDALRIGVLIEDAVNELEVSSQENDIFALGSEIALKKWKGEI